MIRKQTLSGTSWEAEPFVDPTAGELLLVVDGDAAVLNWCEMGVSGNQSCAFQVSARSLLLALRAAYDDARAANANASRGASQDRDDGWGDSLVDDKKRHAPHGGEPWTAELDDQLRRIWLDPTFEGDPSRPYRTRLEIVAEDMGRTSAAVAARLRRLGYDPESPDGLLGGGELAPAGGGTGPDERGPSADQ